MASNKEKFADKMEFPPAIEQPNVYPLSWNSKTKKLQEVWEAARREDWDPEKLPWLTRRFSINCLNRLSDEPEHLRQT